MEKLNEKQVKDFLDDIVQAYNNYLSERDGAVKIYNKSIVNIAVKYKADGMSIYVPEENIHYINIPREIAKAAVEFGLAEKINSDCLCKFEYKGITFWG